MLAYDGDAAGQGAAEKWYGWEQQFEIQLEVADLPAGRDPADVWHDDPQQLLAAVERAAPFLQFRLDRVLASADLATLEGRARAGETAAAIVAEHPSDLVRDQYVMKLAGGLDIDADRMREAVSRAAARPRPQEPRPRSQSNEPPDDERDEPERHPPRRIDRRETDLLRWAIHEPELVVDWLEPYLFTDPIAAAAFEHIEASNIHDALAASEGQVRLLLERLAVEDVIVDDEPETLPRAPDGEHGRPASGARTHEVRTRRQSACERSQSAARRARRQSCRGRLGGGATQRDSVARVGSR